MKKRKERVALKVTTIPYPDRAILDKQDMNEYITKLVFNAMAWLKVDGYVFYVLFPGDPGFRENQDAGASITVEFPYKKFRISIQQDSMEKMRTEPLSNKAFWRNIESSIFHEVIHILVWRISELAARRFTTQEDIREADEELTDHFTHLIHSLVVDHRNR